MGNKPIGQKYVCLPEPGLSARVVTFNPEFNPGIMHDERRGQIGYGQHAAHKTQEKAKLNNTAKEYEKGLSHKIKN